eukprot:8267578-Pyramimonas_sp.AAC.1
METITVGGDQTVNSVRNSRVAHHVGDAGGHVCKTRVHSIRMRRWWLTWLAYVVDAVTVTMYIPVYAMNYKLHFLLTVDCVIFHVVVTAIII